MSSDVMKKFLLSATVLGVFALYSIHLKSDTEGSGRIIAINTPNPISTPVAGTAPPVNTPAAVSTPAPTVEAQTGRYKNGAYVGDVADAFYGNIQVKVIISAGKVSDVQFLQYPNDRRTSVFINSQAMPYLKQEAIQAQSARVNGVSGATATSGAFRQSLASALSQAKI